ncbi:MAG: hypothetical protein LiPW41_454 [Parcubacteria group bacterium LiPW_41]|nr:MAG: hypothetical protein LiPW41_454 [Parcubacteria group bacterium LiPW_41]
MVANSFHTSKKFFTKNRDNFKKKQEKIKRPKIKKDFTKEIIFSKCLTAAEVDAIMRMAARLSFLF